MPDPARAHRAAPSDRTRRTEADPNKPSGPLWAQAVHHFYDPIFDIRSAQGFQHALNDFVLLPADERAFHETHLLYRLVQGLEAVHGALTRIEARLGAVADLDLSALEHLEPIRDAIEEIAADRSSLLAVEGWAPEEDLDEPEEEDGEPTHEEDEDPDIIYDRIPREPPLRARPEPSPAPPPRPEPSRDPDVQREALVGDLVPATEGPQGDGAGDR